MSAPLPMARCLHPEFMLVMAARYAPCMTIS
jgi:hypothetical protein